MFVLFSTLMYIRYLSETRYVIMNYKWNVTSENHLNKKKKFITSLYLQNLYVSHIIWTTMLVCSNKYDDEDLDQQHTKNNVKWECNWTLFELFVRKRVYIKMRCREIFKLLFLLKRTGGYNKTFMFCIFLVWLLVTRNMYCVCMLKHWVVALVTKVSKHFSFTFVCVWVCFSVFLIFFDFLYVCNITIYSEKIFIQLSLICILKVQICIFLTFKKGIRKLLKFMIILFSAL